MAQHSRPGQPRQAVSGWRRRGGGRSRGGPAAVAGLAGAGPAAAKPKPPVLTFTPSSYDYGRSPPADGLPGLHPGQFGRQATGRLKVTLDGAAGFTITATAAAGPAPPRQVLCGQGGVRAHQPGHGDRDPDRGQQEARRDRHRGAHRRRGGGWGRPPATCTGPTPSPARSMGSNLDGGGQTVVTGQSGPLGIAVDASHLYWTHEGGPINRANLDGSNPQSSSAVR